MSVIIKVQIIVDAANSSAAVRPMMRNWDKLIGLSFDLTNVQICFAGGKASLNQYNANEDIFFTLKETTLDRLLRREITPLMAKMQGLIHSSGNIIDILRFSSILTTSIKECNLDNSLRRV